MKGKVCITLLFSVVLVSSVFAQETFKAMFYNLLNYPQQQPASRIDNLETIIDDYQPDLFMICELNSEQGSDNILSMLQTLNPNYLGATYESNTSDDPFGNQNDLQNMMYYDGNKFILEDESIVVTDVRDFNHYTLKLNSIDQATNPVTLHVFVTHLKASDGITNQNIRFEMVIDFVNYLDALSQDSYVLLGGDLNFYRASENGFQKLIDTDNHITLVDPADRIGSWHNNSNFIDVFTQSTRTQSGLGGATGGFDDRFDFILTSESMDKNLNTESELYFVPNSYKSFGNNGNPNCYNQSIFSDDCDGVEYSTALRNDLYLMSDHLPVIMSLETTESLSLNSFETAHAYSISGSNLVSDWLSLKFVPNLLNSNSLKIVNTIGQNVGSFNISNLNHLKINTSKLADGIYYVVPNNYALMPLKFIKK
jgi:hypothetical protein